jgi:hypothetical protein
MDKEVHGGSFRDPNGFVFLREGQLYRQVRKRYQLEYDHFIQSGLYDELVSNKLLVPHEEIHLSFAVTDDAYKVLRPQVIPFISYPHEWCFSQFKDAALLTLAIQKKALEHGMSLKDCSAFNVQFYNGGAIFIDTLSFERYREGNPWVAYRQFCQHFLAPLSLMSYKDVRLNQLFRIHLDGIPLDLASSLLPYSSRLSIPLLTHIHLHSRYQSKYADETEKPVKRGKVSRTALLGIVDNLESSIKRLNWKPRGTEWAEYYDDTNYTGEGLECKDRLVGEFLDTVQSGIVWDLGSNTGRYSKIAAERSGLVVSFDVDPAAVERNYLACIQERRRNILPILLDLINPTPGLGWSGHERMSLLERGPADTVMSLALIHHLAISNNLPFERIAELLARICTNLVVEFIPKEDSQVRRLLVCREDIFDDYTQSNFEGIFSRHFAIERAEKIVDSLRTLYLMRKKSQ